MYTRKLLKNNITVGTVLGAVAMLLAIIFFFKYMSFQDAKQDIDEMISDHGVLTAEDKDKIDLFQPTLLMILGGSLVFGATVYVQMFMMSLQMNVSRKHLNIANLISQVVFSVFIVGTLVAGQICSGLLFSELCKDKYEWLSGKYRDMMFDLRLSGRSTSLVAQMVNNPPAMRETWVQSLGGKIPWRRDSYPLQYSCLENPMDRGAWRVQSMGSHSHSQTRLSD